MIIRLRDHKIAYKVIFSAAFLLFFLFVFNIKGFCATQSENTIPYIVPYAKNQTTAVPDSVINSTYEYLLNNNVISSDDEVLYFVTDVSDNLPAWGYNAIQVVVNPYYPNNILEDFNYYDNSLMISGSSYFSIEYQLNGNIRGPYGYGGPVSILGRSSVVSNSLGDYIPRYPFFYVGDGVYSSNDILIITNDVPYSPNVPTQGHATQPTNNPNNFINGSNGQPITRPTQPTINNYTWTTYNAPPIDTSSLESLVESLIDNVVYGFEYLKNNLSGEFSNLINNIESLINYVVLSLENGFNKVIQAIQDIMTDLYNNFVSLFEPITEQLAYITEPFDSSTFESQFNSTSAMNILNVCSTSYDTFKTTFTNVSEPESYILQLDFNMPSSSILSSYIVDGEINFNWLIPLKSVYRPLLWILFIAFAFISILTNIGNYLKGFSGGSDG